jgi:hypothetical protein
MTLCCTQDLRKAGVEGVAVCAFLEDHHLVEPSFHSTRFAIHKLNRTLCCAQDLLRKAGVEGIAVCAFLEDHHLVEPSFLEYINSLLSS